MIEPFSQSSEVVNRIKGVIRSSMQADNKSRGSGSTEGGLDDVGVGG